MKLSSLTSTIEGVIKPLGLAATIGLTACAEVDTAKEETGAACQGIVANLDAPGSTNANELLPNQEMPPLLDGDLQAVITENCTEEGSFWNCPAVQLQVDGEPVSRDCYEEATTKLAPFSFAGCVTNWEESLISPTSYVHDESDNLNLTIRSNGNPTSFGVIAKMGGEPVTIPQKIGTEEGGVMVSCFDGKQAYNPYDTVAE